MRREVQTVYPKRKKKIVYTGNIACVHDFLDIIRGRDDSRFRGAAHVGGNG